VRRLPELHPFCRTVIEVNFAKISYTRKDAKEKKRCTNDNTAENLNWMSSVR